MNIVSMRASAVTPSLPPSNPAFREIVASIPRSIERYGVAKTAEFVRGRVETLNRQITEAAAGDEKRLDAMRRDGVTAFDLSELVIWLERRATELELSRAA